MVAGVSFPHTHNLSSNFQSNSLCIWLNAFARPLSLVLSGSVGLCVQCNAFAIAIAIAITVANVVASHLAVCSVLLNFAMLLLVVRF